MTWNKDGYFWRKPGPAWEEQIYGYPINGKGDLGFNSCAEEIDDFDIDDIDDTLDTWVACGKLLKERKRWPDRMAHYCDANNWFQWRWSQLKFKLGIKTGWWIWNDELGEYELKMLKTVMYRPQNNITRDPHIAWITLTVLLKGELAAGCIEDIKIPWYLYRPGIWAWRKYLITGDLKYGKRYVFWDRFDRKVTPGYVSRLDKYMTMAIAKKV